MVHTMTKSQTIFKENYGYLNSPKKRMKLSILNKESAQDTEVGFFEN